MKRILILTMVLGLVLGSIASAEAKKKKKKPAAPVRIERVVEYAYDAPGIGISSRPPPAAIATLTRQHAQAFR